MSDKSNYKIVFWDWYKTLSDLHLYQKLRLDHPKSYLKIEAFVKSNPTIIEDWLNTSHGFKFLHEKFAEITALQADVFQAYLSQINSDSLLRKEILPLLEKLHKKNISQIILADNFDVWDEMFLPNYLEHFEKYFLGLEILFAKAAQPEKDWQEKIKSMCEKFEVDISEVLLVEDSSEVAALFSELGGDIILHDGSIEQITSKIDEVFNQ